MLVRRFKTKDGRFVEGEMTTDGDRFDAFLCATCVVVETDHGDSHPFLDPNVAALSARLGKAVVIVEGETDPWDGISDLLKPTPEAGAPAQMGEQKSLDAIQEATTILGLRTALLEYLGATG